MVAVIDERRFRLRERNGIHLAVRQWRTEVRETRAVIVLAHGMGEHSGRYLAPLTPLIGSGETVYALDHRGHGLSIPEGGTPGDFGPGGFVGVESDLVALVELARTENPGMPLVLVGHSMGSMISQAFLLDHARLIDGLVLSGSAAVDVLAAAGASDPNILAMLNLPFEPARTPFDWLSRNEAEVDLYMADPLCGFGLVPGSFIELLSQGPALADPVRIGAVPKDLPIWIASGDRDPLCNLLGAVQPLIDRYKTAGLEVSATLYSGARHEIFNETNRDEVIADLAAFVEGVIAKSATVRANTRD